jgi:hypothetical protein
MPFYAFAIVSLAIAVYKVGALSVYTVTGAR